MAEDLQEIYGTHYRSRFPGLDLDHRLSPLDIRSFRCQGQATVLLPRLPGIPPPPRTPVSWYTYASPPNVALSLDSVKILLTSPCPAAATSLSH